MGNVVHGVVKKSTKVTTLKELFDYQIGFARRWFEGEGDISPMWVGQDEEGTIYPLVVQEFDSPAVKMEAITTVKEIFREFKVVRCVSMVEAWLLKAPKPTGPIDIDKLPVPSESPDREECILLQGEGIGEESLSGLIPITRDKDGKGILGEYMPNEAGEPEWSKAGSMLPTKPPATRH